MEDHVHQGGFGVMAEAMAKEKGWRAKAVNLSLPDKFIPQDNRTQAIKRYGLDHESVYHTIWQVAKGEYHGEK